MKDKKQKVFVGLSGGVDSAVSAALLKEQGFDVTGVFIKAWSPPGFPCTWKEDRRSAMRAAAVLDIPFLTLDLEKEYKNDVVDYMIREYREGKTPNPDVMCNKEIKFGHFLKFALASGADFVATGHYAKLSKNKKESFVLSGAKGKEEKMILMEGLDKNKDQTYFLWTLTQEQLKHTLFPIGHLEKQEVRKLAEKFGLPQATRKDSQGLCFLGKIDMKEFLKKYLDLKVGDVLNESGEVIGEHDGAELYTLGERHGFRLFKQTALPMYVVGKDVEKNTITVSENNLSSKSIFQKVLACPTCRQGGRGSPLLRSTRLFSKNFSSTNSSDDFSGLPKLIHSQNWISGEAPRGEIECRLRYRQTKIKCRVEGDSLFLPEGEIVAPGQSVVFYSPADGIGKDEICLGGAIIAE